LNYSEEGIIHHDVDSIAEKFIVNSKILGKRGEEDLRRLQKT